MSIDRSLRLKSSLERHRNVLSRAERVTWLLEQDRWGDRESALGLPKIAHRKAKAAKKKVAKIEGEAAEAAALGVTPGAAAPTAAAAGAGPAKPGAKPAAKPAGK